MLSAWRNWRRQRAARRLAIGAEAWAAAERPLRCLAHLDDAARQRLRELAAAFIAEKEWSAAAGLTLTAEIQLSIALQACLPILNLGLDWYRGWVGIVVYPGDFIIPRQVVDEDGIVHEFDDAVLGEAWEGGPVLLSWFAEAEAPEAVSLVIHEFAHKLDMSNGAVDGMPALHPEMRAEDWIGAFSAAYEDFCRRIDRGEETEIDPYAAEHPSEFFAVASEVFFEAPSLLHDTYPAVYAQLAQFYRQDPGGHGYRNATKLG